MCKDRSVTVSGTAGSALLLFRVLQVAVDLRSNGNVINVIRDAS